MVTRRKCSILLLKKCVNSYKLCLCNEDCDCHESDMLGIRHNLHLTKQYVKTTTLQAPQDNRKPYKLKGEMNIANARHTT